MIPALAIPTTAEGRARRRHRFYRTLLVLCLLVMLSLAFPLSLRGVGALGYFLISVITMLELGAFLHLGASRTWHDRCFLALGVANLLAQLFWFLTPASQRLSGVPLLLLATPFIGWALVRLVRLVSREPRATSPVVVGAVAGYLLLGLSGGLVLSVLETIEPGSFRSNAGDPIVSLVRPGPGRQGQLHSEFDFAGLNYFAFVTLGTIGYGDIIPVRPPARMASVLLGVAGPLYIAVILGVLISRFSGPEEGGR